MVAYLTQAPAPSPEHLAEIARLEANAQDQRRRSQESFDRCDTDGFLSQWANDIGAELNARKAELLRNGGYARFRVLCDAAGNVVADRIHEFADRYAPEWSNATVKRWRLPDDLAAKHGRKWVPVAGYSGKSRVQKKLELHEEDRWFRAYAKITTPRGAKSTGLAGCANAYVGTFRADLHTEH